MKKGFFGFLLAAALMLALIACGGNNTSSTNLNQNSRSSTNTFLTGEDAPLPAVLGFNVTLNSITLTGTDGSTASLLSTPETVDFARLVGLRDILAFNSVPAGTYNSVTFQLANPVITYLNISTTPPSTSTLNGTWASTVSTSNGVATVTVALRNPVTLDASGLVGFHMHFDLRKSLQVDAAGQVTGVIDPKITANGCHPDDDDAQITDLRGSIASVDAANNKFVLQRFNGKQITVSVNSSTTYNNGNSLSTLTAGQVAEVSGTIQADGTILASQVAVVAVQHAYLEGTIVYVDPNGKNITVLVAEEHPAIPGISQQSLATLDISNVQNYDIGSIDNWLTSFVFNGSSLVVGQRVAIGGSLDITTNPATFTPARIVLQRQGVDGMLVASNIDLAAGTFQLQNNGLVGYVLGAPLTVKTSQRTRFFGVNGISGLQQLPNTTRISVRGLILKDQTSGQTVMYAQWVSVQQ